MYKENYIDKICGITYTGAAKKSEAEMKKYLLCIFTAVIFFLIESCSNSNPLPSPVESGIMTGRVYSIGAPGPIPIGWTPPPYKQVCTIQTLDTQKNIVAENKSNEQGVFQIIVPPGFYYLRVKKSPIPAETGPYQVKIGVIISVVANYDNGMR